MTIQCDQCHTRHDVDPPAWVISSGKPFRFRCSACGHSQSVSPTVLGSATRDTPLPPALIDTPPPVERVEAESDDLEPTDPQSMVTVARDATPTNPGTITGPTEDADEQGVFLKQNGQIYMVKDWQTLSRWIVEKRVDADDLVSEGGVRWEAIGARRDLAPLFAPAPGAHAPFPFGAGSAVFSGDADAAWNDDDTEGVPTGLPPLPTEEVGFGGSPLPPALLDDDPVLENSDQSDPEPQPKVVDEDEEDTDDSDLVHPTPPTSMLHEGPPPLIVSPSLGPGPHDASDQGMSIDGPRTTTPAAGITAVPVDDWEDLLTREDDETEIKVIAKPAQPPALVTEPPPSRPQFVVVAPDEETWDDEDWDAAFRRQRRNLWFGGMILVIALVGAAWIGWTRFPVPDTRIDTSTPIAVGTAAPEPAPVPPLPAAPLPDPAPAPAPTPAPAVAHTSPKPTPKPAAAPKPAAPKPAAPAPASGGNASQLASRGWNLADSNSAEAERLFKQALAIDPGHDDANYGYGYLLLQRNETGRAAPYLCRARSSPKADIRQDVNGLIASYGLSCP